MYTYEYPRPAVTTDCLVFCHQDDVIKILLIKRRNEPFKDHWAFPGGFLDMNETAEECAARELNEETGLKIKPKDLCQIGAFSRVDRDPRGRTISIAFCTFVDNIIDAEAADDAAEAQWFSIDELPPLAFDHEEIFNAAIEILEEE